MTLSATTRHGSPVIGLPGRAALELRHKPAHGQPSSRPDIGLVQLDNDAWHLLGASSRGVQHSLRGEPRQDGFGVVEVDDTVYAVVCDGVGEFPRSHEAADHVVHTLLTALVERRDVDTAVKQANADLQVMAEDGCGPLATTLLVAATRVLGIGWLSLDLAWIGDPYAWTLLDGTWTLLNPQPPRESVFFSSATIALPMAEPSLQRVSVSVRADAVFYMTDGVGQPLDDIDEVREALASWWTAQPNVYEFASQVGFARKSHMDDRTVVGLWPVHSEAADLDGEVADEAEVVKPKALEEAGA